MVPRVTDYNPPWHGIDSFAGYLAEILPIRRKTLSDQSFKINHFVFVLDMLCIYVYV